MNIRPVGEELFRADRQTDGGQTDWGQTDGGQTDWHEEANSRFSWSCERA